MNKEKIKSSLLIVPANDAEALQILDIAEKIGLATHASYQLHGGRLDAEPDIRKIIERSNKPAIAVVELPGPETEAFIRSLGKEFVCIDHHGYDGLDRSRDEQGNFQPSSLEQFLNYFEISDADLSALGFDPRLVRSIGIMDQGYVWELSKNGYSPDEVRTAVAYKQKFHERLSPKEEIERVMAVARRAW
ncbi:TPA: hypothetical protein DCZ32_03095, partial [Candidatus Uhrbacteria bacterium]|nr:hypothetical protein [Candidatus Uhrbacteria bacterium]